MKVFGLADRQIMATIKQAWLERMGPIGMSHRAGHGNHQCNRGSHSQHGHLSLLEVHDTGCLEISVLLPAWSGQKSRQIPLLVEGLRRRLDPAARRRTT
jgi:hypothetical protein